MFRKEHFSHKWPIYLFIDDTNIIYLIIPSLTKRRILHKKESYQYKKGYSDTFKFLKMKVMFLHCKKIPEEMVKSKRY